MVRLETNRNFPLRRLDSNLHSSMVRLETVSGTVGTQPFADIYIPVWLD